MVSEEVSKIVSVILGVIVVFLIMFGTFPGIKTGVNNIFITLGGFIGLELETMPGGGGSGGSCNVDVSTCQLAVMHSPSLTADQVREVLSRANSPALEAEPDIAEWFYSESLRTGIDNAIALAFFKHESTYGKYGKAPTTKSIGNIKYTNVCKNNYGGTNHEGFCSYPEWKAGVSHWYNLIKDGYVSKGYDTLGEIIARYAPCSENNIRNYIADVTAFASAHGRNVDSCPITA